jgi:hypothetical protein
MTIGSIIVLCAIGLAFMLFGGVLAWGDFYSRTRPQEQISAAPELASSTATDTTKFGKAA